MDFKMKQRYSQIEKKKIYESKKCCEEKLLIYY